MKILPDGKSCPELREREGAQKNGSSFMVEAAPAVSTSDFALECFNIEKGKTSWSY